MGYLDGLGDHWGEMCGTADLAAEWADWLVSTLEEVWRFPNRGHFPGTGACLSSLLATGRPERVLELIALEGYVDLWFYRRYGVEALKQLGRMEEALALARRKTRYDTESQIDLAIEELLIEMGRAEEAYREVGLHLRRAGTYKRRALPPCANAIRASRRATSCATCSRPPPTRACGSRPRSGWASWTSPPKSPAPPATPAR